MPAPPPRRVLAALLRLAALIDAGNAAVGRSVAWFVVAAVLISAGNAVARKVFDASSNAWLEVQWYLFGAVVLLAAADTLRRQGHVRIDVVLGRFSRRVQVGVELFGTLAFLLPFAAIVVTLAWPLVVGAWASGEMSSNAGGLLRWPVYALVPAGFVLLALQAVAEVIKRVGFLRGACADPGDKGRTPSAEEQLAATIRARGDTP